MKELQNSTALRISYYLVTLAWISTLCGLILIPVISILTLTTDIELIDFKLTFPINTEVILFAPENNTHFMKIESAQASADLNYIAENYAGAYLGVSFLAVISILIIFYAVHLLRNMIRNLREDEVFIPYNLISIKRIAIAMLALSPAEWFYRIILKTPFESYLQSNKVVIDIGSADFGFISAGLLIYILGLIFERGYQQHEELKLTV